MRNTLFGSYIHITHTLIYTWPVFQFEWLCGHFRARHAPKAQPLRCLISECTTRFSNQKALIAHLRNSHDDDKPGECTDGLA